MNKDVILIYGKNEDDFFKIKENVNKLCTNIKIKKIEDDYCNVTYYNKEYVLCIIIIIKEECSLNCINKMRYIYGNNVALIVLTSKEFLLDDRLSLADDIIALNNIYSSEEIELRILNTINRIKKYKEIITKQKKLLSNMLDYFSLNKEYKKYSFITN